MRCIGVLTLALATGCSLLTSLDGFDAQGPGSDGGPADGAAASDGQGGGPPGDVSDAEAGSADGGLCAHTFCESFDDGELGARWDTTSTTNGGALTLVPDHAVSKPRALKIDVAGSAEPPTAYLALDLKAKAAHKLTLGFSLFIEHRGDEYFQPVEVVLGPSGLIVGLLFGETAAYLSTDGKDVNGDEQFKQIPVAVVPEGTQTECKLTITIPPSTNDKIRVALDCTMGSASTTIDVTPTPFDLADVRLGLRFIGATLKPSLAYVDDVWVDVTP